MSGGLLQLVALGVQDVYLTSNPQITFFKQLYRRHSNFAMECIEQTFHGIPDFGKRISCSLSRNGDLISRIYLQATLPSVNVSETLGSSSSETTFQWVDHIGHALIQYVEFDIGGQVIDKQYGEWMYIWNELTLPTSKRGALDVMVGSDIKTCSNSPSVTNNICDQIYGAFIDPGRYATCPSFRGANNPESSRVLTVNKVSCLPEVTLYVPLEFCFCRHIGLALPLVALQYHEVKLTIQLTNLTYLCNILGPGEAPMFESVLANGLSEASIWCDYIFLDKEERRRFTQATHEYLIDQLQYTGSETVTGTFNNIKLTLNHPVKELVWVTQREDRIHCSTQPKQPFNFTDTVSENPTLSAKLQLNGRDRFESRFGAYFNFVQPFQHHTNTPAVGINVYSFALKPEDHQPSGSCNFSRIDTAVLNLTLSTKTFDGNTVAHVRIYALNYNILRITSGMGGLVYSN